MRRSQVLRRARVASSHLLSRRLCWRLPGQTLWPGDQSGMDDLPHLSQKDEKVPPGGGVSLQGVPRGKAVVLLRPH